MTIPPEYGGHGRGFLERFAVTEELLAAGAPVGFHWIADRQVAPSLLRFGTEEQKQAYLPRIAAGECSFAIGMSEPDSGSDLASVRARAEKADGGWRVTGTKVWTSGAHEAEAFIALVRTALSSADPQHRRDGLSQLIVDLRAPGVRISPIISMTGPAPLQRGPSRTDVFIPDQRLALGDAGFGMAPGHQRGNSPTRRSAVRNGWLSTFCWRVRAWASGEVGGAGVRPRRDRGAAARRSIRCRSRSPGRAPGRWLLTRLQAMVNGQGPRHSVRRRHRRTSAPGHQARRPKWRCAEAIDLALLQRPWGSPYAAVRTRFCAASSPAGWGCDEQAKRG